MRADDPLSLSLLYHLNSEPWLNSEAYSATPYVQEFKIPGGVEARTLLPSPELSDLAGLIATRRSVRAFADRSMSMCDVSQLLAAASGAVGLAALPGGRFLRRSAPSAGGLYPLETYAFIRRVDDLSDGLYHYDVRGHAAACLERGDFSSRLESIFYTYPFVEKANLIICLSAVFGRVQSKYGPRGYRYALLEAGHAAQNLCLAAAERGCGSLCMGGFEDSALNRLLGLSPLEEGIIYTVAAGWPAEQPESEGGSDGNVPGQHD